jgi:hypothetical protein
LRVVFALLDPDPDSLTRLNPDPIRIRIRIHNPGCKHEFVQVESDYAEVKAHYEELKLEVSRLESATADISSSSDIYETIRPSRQGPETLADGIEER